MPEPAKARLLLAREHGRLFSPPPRTLAQYTTWYAYSVVKEEQVARRRKENNP